MSPLLQKYFSAIKKILPIRENLPSVGLDIGTSACKVVVLQKDAGAYRLLSWAIEPVRNGDQKQAVKKLLSGVVPAPQSVLMAVSGKGTLIRYIDLPRMALSDLKKSFAIEADKYFPFPLDRIYTDCHILDANGKDNKMAVLVAAAKKELIDDRLAMMTELGLPTDFISLDAIAIANAVHVLGLTPAGEAAAPAAKDEAAAVLEIGELSSGLTIFVDNLPCFSRDIYLGGRDLTKAISSALGLDYDQAEALKNHPGPRREEVVRACEVVIAKLVAELRLSFDYFITEKNVSQVRLWLTGGGGRLTGMDEDLSRHLDMPVSRWDPTALLAVAEGVDRAALGQQAAQLATAMGLALYS